MITWRPIVSIVVCFIASFLLQSCEKDPLEEIIVFDCNSPLDEDKFYFIGKYKTRLYLDPTGPDYPTGICSVYPSNGNCEFLGTVGHANVTFNLDKTFKIYIKTVRCLIGYPGDLPDFPNLCKVFDKIVKSSTESYHEVILSGTWDYVQTITTYEYEETGLNTIIKTQDITGKIWLEIEDNPFDSFFESCIEGDYEVSCLHEFDGDKSKDYLGWLRIPFPVKNLHYYSDAHYPDKELLISFTTFEDIQP